MMFRKVDSPEPVVDYLVEVLGRELGQSRRVLWMVSGGSCIPIAVEVAKRLAPTGLKNLTVTLIDERYGPVGHADSNWKQLQDAGFAPPGATLHPVLSGKGMPETAKAFEAFLQKELAAADYRLGLFGIGPDGHTSGILPHSSAAHAGGLTHAYEGGGYQRVTTTAEALSKLDEAVVYAVGEAKWPVLDKLETDVSPDEQPAQYLKQVPKTTIYNDHKGEQG